MSELALGNVLVLGLGKTGEALCRHLAAHLGAGVDSVTLYGGAAQGQTDLTRELEGLGVRCVLGTEEVEGIFDLCVASPGIPEASAFAASARAHARELISEPELAFRESPERWVAITGTNGKTTTTRLTAHLLEACGMDAECVGNIGTSVIGEVDARPEGLWFVAELSSFQLAESSTLRPSAACILNLTPDHVEWHGTLEAYAAAKERLFQNMVGKDLAVVSVDDAYCKTIAERLEARGARVCRLSVVSEPEGEDAAFLRGGELIVRRAGEELDLGPMAGLAIVGAHNAQNALAASAMALEVGVSPEAIRAALPSFSPLEHRIEPAGEVAGVRYVNDSKATNTDSVEKALLAFDAGKIVVLLGGHDKGTELGSLADAVAGRCRVAVCYGEAGERIAKALEAASEAQGAALSIIRAPHMREAFTAAVEAAEAGETVLLSPACSSFDEFNNMGERGRLFKSLVADLAAESGA